MTHQPETARELASLAANAGRALQDEKRHYEIACQENARLRAALARIRQMTDYWEQHLPEVIRTPAVVSALRAAMERAEPTAVSAAVAPPTNQTALRDRIAAAIWERQNPGRRYADCEYRWQADAEADADAVLAVLPPTTDRAAVRAQAFDEAADMLAKLDPVKAALAGEHAWKDAAGLARHMARQARRMADETATETHAVTTVPCSGTLGTQHQPHNWEPQPGMDPVHCPGTRKPPMDPVHILGIEAADEPAAGARQDGAQS